MIYTVTFNPAIDYVMKFDSYEHGGINRAAQEELFFGGKGINVSFVLSSLGVKSTALGFVAGFTGKAIENGVRESGVDADFVTLREGNSRINVKVKSDGETELNGQGPVIDRTAMDELYNKLDRLKKGDILVLAGSIPPSLPDNIYETIMARLDGRGILFIVDAEKKLLTNVLKYKPFLIKPNDIELGEIFGTHLSDTEQITQCARILRDRGARNVLVSRAEKGAVLCDENGDVHIMGTAKGEVRNSVGAGDSMLAGFIAGYLEKKDFSHALKLGTACGGATAFSDGLCTREQIYRILEQI